MLLRRALSFLSLTLLTTLAHAEPPRESIKVEIAPEIMASLTPEQKLEVRKILDVLEPHLYTWTQLPIELPESALLDGTRFFNLTDLILPPASEDVRKLGGDIRLNEAQLAQVHETGSFQVPSEEYPGRVHVWKYHTWLQKGAQAIRLQVERDQKSAQDQIKVEIPARLFGDDPTSVRRGLHNIRFALREVGDVLIGLRHKTTTRDQFERSLQYDTEQFLKQNPPRTGPASQIIEDETRGRVYHTLNKVNAASEVKWGDLLDGVIANAKTKFSPTDSPELWTKELVTLVAREKQDFFYGEIEKAPELAAIDPSLGQFLVRQGRALEIIRGAEAKWAEEVRFVADSEVLAYKTDHPWQSASQKKLERLASKAAQNYREQKQWEFYYGVVDQLRAAGLTDEAMVLQSQVNFFRGRFANAEIINVPSHRFEFPMQIYQQSRWQTTHLKNGEWRIVQTYNLNSDTSNAGWRGTNIGLRTLAGWNQGLYALFVHNLWNGPLGLRALGNNRPFPYRYRAVQDKELADLSPGTIVPDTTDLQKTMRSRVQQSREQGDRILADFEKQTDFAFSRELTKIVVAVRAKFYYKMAWPAAFFIGQPILTAVNVIASSTIGTGLVLAGTPFVSVGVWAGQALIFDSAQTSRQPLLRLERAVLSGVGGVAEGILATGGAITHLAGAGYLDTMGKVRGAIRTAWDGLWLKLIASQANIPQRDHAGIVRRIKGPGLDADFYFHLKPALIQGVLLGELESREVEAHVAMLRNLIEKPAKDAVAALAPLRAIAGNLNLRAESPLNQTINERQAKWQDELNTLLKERNNKRDTQLRVPKQSLNHIRLSQTDWISLLRDSTVLVESFTKQKVFKNMSKNQIAQSWRDANLDANDWTGLTRKMLSQSFGEAILVPLDPADDSFEITVNNPDLESSLDGLLQGEVPRDEEIRTHLPIKSVTDYHGNPSLLINSEAMCSRLLLDIHHL